MMRLYEYQGKELLKTYNIPVPEGRVASTPAEAVAIYQELDKEVVLKAQVLAGGRGLAGGVKFASSTKEVKTLAEGLFSNEIRGLPVKKLLVEEKIDIRDEYYLALMLDRTRKKPILLGTTQGGVSIEKMAHEQPEMLSTVPINPLVGAFEYHGLELFSKFDLSPEIRKKISYLIKGLYNIFKEREAFLVEINPLVITATGDVIATDCKITIDPEASYGKKDTSPRYIPLDGDIGIIANGAGLTMTTMDVVKYYGGNPANFLEVGGDFYKRAGEALEYLLTRRKDLKGLIVNLFGAYARTDVIIEQIVEQLLKTDIDIPVSFRIRGTGEERAREIVRTKLGKEAHLDLGKAVKELMELVSA
jgi:succinyl-CoA synthetase beta subunit